MTHVPLQFDDHGSVIDVTLRPLSLQATAHMQATEQKEVTCFSLLEELFFIYHIKSPKVHGEVYFLCQLFSIFYLV
jgi:hypothetical protein